MGRKTFESFRAGRCPGRTNIVMTRNAGYAAEGAVVTTSLAGARAIATGDALRRGATQIAVIGGADVMRCGFRSPIASKSPKCMHVRPATPRCRPSILRRGRKPHVSGILREGRTPSISPM